MFGCVCAIYEFICASPYVADGPCNLANVGDLPLLDTPLDGAELLHHVLIRCAQTRVCNDPDLLGNSPLLTRPAHDVRIKAVQSTVCDRNRVDGLTHPSQKCDLEEPCLHGESGLAYRQLTQPSSAISNVVPSTTSPAIDDQCRPSADPFPGMRQNLSATPTQYEVPMISVGADMSSRTPEKSDTKGVYQPPTVGVFAHGHNLGFNYFELPDAMGEDVSPIKTTNGGLIRRIPWMCRNAILSTLISL